MVLVVGSTTQVIWAFVLPHAWDQPNVLPLAKFSVIPQCLKPPPSEAGTQASWPTPAPLFVLPNPNRYAQVAGLPKETQASIVTALLVAMLIVLPGRSTYEPKFPSRTNWPPETLAVPIIVPLAPPTESE